MIDVFISFRRLTRLYFVSLLLLLAAISPTAILLGQEPYIPASDDEVLVVLPKSLLVDRDAMRKLRSQLMADPKNSDLASTVAQRYLSIGKRGGDPRFYGYARSAIGPWWEDDSAPPAILKLRAKLKENDHQFDDAANDLGLALQQTPDDPQLLLELANVLRVQGKYDKALEIGDRLEKISGVVPAALCRAPLFVMTGRAAEAYDLLNEILPIANEKFPSTIDWITTVQADAALALGKDLEVEQHFQDGLAENAADVQILRRFADFLLDRNRNQEALDLLREHVADNGVLLRAAIAAKRCSDSSAHEWSSQLQQRFDEIRLRGSEPHGRFESRFALQVMNQPEQALELAAKNWQRQKEVRDARNFMEAAIAADDPGAATQVIEFIEKNGMRHASLDPLVESLKALQ